MENSTAVINLHPGLYYHQDARIELNLAGLKALKKAIEQAEAISENHGGIGQGIANVFDSEGEEYTLAVNLYDALDKESFDNVDELFRFLDNDKSE